MKNDALSIINYAIRAADPYKNTCRVLSEQCRGIENVTVLSIGKAAVPMAKAAFDVLGEQIKTGLVVTKYGHSENFCNPKFEIIESAHPVSDENSVIAAEKALKIANSATKQDTIIVLLSGGGSALLEKSSVPAKLQQQITKKLLSRGAEISEINAIRKRLSLVKGGRLAAEAYPAKVITLALSDVLSNDKSVIASGITVPDTADDAFVKRVAEKYLFDEDKNVINALYCKADIKINDGGYFFVGDINLLCDAALQKAKMLGYNAECVSRALCGEARLCAEDIIDYAVKNAKTNVKSAFIYGGETTVTLKGNGKGGRNQEMALYAAIKLKNKNGLVFASCGSDGTDGPTDAAGGIADSNTYNDILSSGLNPNAELENNNSYFALKAAQALIFTGPTGTNVNDITLVLTNN